MIFANRRQKLRVMAFVDAYRAWEANIKFPNCREVSSCELAFLAGVCEVSATEYYKTLDYIHQGGK